MDNKLEKHLNTLKENQEIFLNFLKAKFPVFHKSNFFFRDFQFGIRDFFDKKDIELSYSDSQKLAEEFGNHLETEGIFKKIDHQTWNVLYPEFETQEPGDPF